MNDDPLHGYTALTRDDATWDCDTIERKYDTCIDPSVRVLKERCPYLEQRTDAWLQKRQGMLTASDFAAAAGVNPYCSPTTLLRKKWDQQQPIAARQTTTSYMRYGTLWEDVAARRYEEETGKTLLTFGLIPCEDHPWLGGSPDGVTTDGVLLEIKCPATRTINVDDHTVPPYYLPQVQGNMYICGLRKAHYVEFRPQTSVLFPEKFKLVEVDFDPEYWHTFLFPKLQAFHLRMVAGPAEMTTGDSGCDDDDELDNGGPARKRRIVGTRTLDLGAAWFIAAPLSTGGNCDGADGTGGGGGCAAPVSQAADE